jgi:integrase
MRLTFSSWLAPHLARHVEVKRASGLDYVAQPRYLAAFDRFLVEQGSRPPLRTRLLQDYLASLSGLCPRSRDNVVAAIWQALAHARRHGAPVEPSPERPRKTPSSVRLREPIILSVAEVGGLVTAARRLSPELPYVQATYPCLFGLLYSTGIRIGEALSLDVDDLDRREQTLLVRAGKFKKSRLLPLAPSIFAALGRYLDDPRRPLALEPDQPFFLSNLRRRLSYTASYEALRRATRLAGLPDGHGRIRLHDLRHTFAVRRVLSWQREGRDVNTLLPLLSTYMGHVSPAHTYSYLRAAAILDGEVARRFERAADAALSRRPQ